MNSLFSAINKLATRSEFLATFSVWVSRPIGYISLLVVCTVPIVLLAHNRAKEMLFLGLNLGGTWLVAHGLKLFFCVPRPVAEGNGITILIQQSGYSFPSEHAAVFAALAVYGWYIDPRLGVAFTVLAAIVGISRVIAGVHFPLDVIAGFCVGILFSIFVCTVGREFFT